MTSLQTFDSESRKVIKAGDLVVRTYQGEISILNDHSVILNGEGKETLLDKIEKNGIFREGKLHGQGFEIFDGKKREGTFIEGEPHGRFVVWDKAGTKRDAFYVDGIEVEKWEEPFLTFDQLVSGKSA